MKNLDNYLNKAKERFKFFLYKVPYEKLNRTVLRKISNNDVNTLPARHFGLKLRPISICCQFSCHCSNFYFYFYKQI